MNLAIVRFGLLIMQLAQVCVIVSVSVALGCSLTEEALLGSSGIICLWGCGIVLPGLLCCVSSIASLAAPSESGARKFAVLMVVLSCPQLLLMAMALVFSFVMPLFAMLGAGVALLLQLNYVLYLNRLSQFVRREDLARSTTRLLTGFVIVPLAAWAISIFVFVLIGPGTLNQIGLIFLAAALTMAVRAVTLTSAVRKALQSTSVSLPVHDNHESMVNAVIV